jgi:hypothetical protein
MLALMTSVLAMALLAESPDSVVLSGVVVDAGGKPLSEVEVLLAAQTWPPDGSYPTLARTMTDDHGAFRLEVARQRLKGIGPIRFIWAYRPGRTVAIQRADVAQNGEMPPVRLTLAEPLPRTVTILDHKGHPVAGVRLAPVFHGGGPASFRTPDDRLERMTVVTGADGVAALPYLPATIDPLTVRVTAPGIAPHHLGLPDRPGRDRITLKLGQPSRLAGSVYDDSGQPASDVAIEVWASNTYDLPMPGTETLKATLEPSLVYFDTGPVRTRSDGSFATPVQLLTGSFYRIIIRSEGKPLVTSDWLTPTTELTTFPPLRLGRHRKLLGLVHDRHGKPVAGARVFLPSGKPSTTTDAQGRYVLEGVLPDKTYLLVRADGFRFQGWPGIPAREPQERKLILVRTSEPPDRTMAPASAPISVEESRALARRVLEPSLQAALAKGGDSAMWDCLRLLSEIDPGRVLELLEMHPLQDPGADAAIRWRVAAKLLTVDPKEAESVVNAIASPKLRALAYVWLADALSAQERERKSGFLELATVQAHAPAGGGGGFDPRSRLHVLARVAGGWLDLGEVDKARPLLREGLELVAAVPKTERLYPIFLATAARVEVDRVLSLMQDLSNARRRTCYVAVAEALANERPAEAERVFQLIDDSSRVAGENRDQIALRLCRVMAKTDPERARRIITGLKTPPEQACGWALLALGLVGRDKPAARSALVESIRVIDRLLDSAEAVRPRLPGIRVANNPAASILPIVEQVAPERLEEVFWKAVALIRRDDAARQRGVADFRIMMAAIFLARYDRQVADVFVTQAMSSQSRNRVFYTPDVIRAKAGVDPPGVVAMMEAVPQAGLDPRALTNEMTNEARETLINYLTEPSEDHWKYVWSSSAIPLDEPWSR